MLLIAVSLTSTPCGKNFSICQSACLLNYLYLNYVWMGITFPAPEKGVHSAFSEANTAFSGACVLKQRAVESSPELHTVMCPEGADRSNPAM